MPPFLRRRSAVALAVALGAASPMGAPAATGIMDLSIEELMALRVTSVAKRDQRLDEAAAAVFVITADDIRRSGVTTLPEALRLAPGITVGRINGGQWAVSARGFASRFANKLLVLVDGRTLYTPLYSGVFWDAQDLMLENVERIEVIRGPGASLWGANAVNGVINIITRPAADTAGGLVSVLAGDVDRGILEARYGGAAGDDGALRVWTRAGARATSPRATDHDGEDEWRRARAGLRYDGALGGGRAMFTAELYDSRVDDSTVLGTLVPPYTTVVKAPLENQAGYVLGSWRRPLDGDGEFSLQAYAESGTLRYVNASERRTTLDVELQHRFRVGASHELTWGAGFRSYRNDVASPGSLSIPSGHYALATAFVQDEVALADRTVHVTGGVRVEHNDFTGVEVQPNLRAAWTPAPGQTLWGALSRAVRTPSIATDLGVLQIATLPPGAPGNPSPLPAALVIQGNGDTRSEVLVAAELGWRAQLAASLAMDVALYSNRYRRLGAQEAGAPAFTATPVPHLAVPLNFVNTVARTINGAEVVADWHPHPRARVKATYTWQTGAENPRHQASLRPSFDLAHNVEADLWLRYVDTLVTPNDGIRIPAYTELDLRLGWRATPSLEVSLVGQNLLHRKHTEFRSDVLGTLPMEVPRAFYLKVRYAF